MKWSKLRNDLGRVFVLAVVLPLLAATVGCKSNAPRAVDVKVSFNADELAWFEVDILAVSQTEFDDLSGQSAAKYWADDGRYGEWLDVDQRRLRFRSEGQGAQMTLVPVTGGSGALPARSTGLNMKSVVLVTRSDASFWPAAKKRFNQNKADRIYVVAVAKIPDPPRGQDFADAWHRAQPVSHKLITKKVKSIDFRVNPHPRGVGLPGLE